jgi:hypothetical protein
VTVCGEGTAAGGVAGGVEATAGAAGVAGVVGVVGVSIDIKSSVKDQEQG